MSTLDLAALIAGRKPGHSLPAPFYLSPQIHERDVALIFGRHWIHVGAEPVDTKAASGKLLGNLTRADLGGQYIHIAARLRRDARTLPKGVGRRLPRWEFQRCGRRPIVRAIG